MQFTIKSLPFIGFWWTSKFRIWKKKNEKKVFYVEFMNQITLHKCKKKYISLLLEAGNGERKDNERIFGQTINQNVHKFDDIVDSRWGIQRKKEKWHSGKPLKSTEQMKSNSGLQKSPEGKLSFEHQFVCDQPTTRNC